MKEHILEILKQIETEYDVKILYACEAGSRTWGLSSEDSDYDIRFIYLHKTDWYLSIDQKRDVLEVPKHDHVKKDVNPLIDMSGWELTKALRLFRKSNPTLLEWLHSSSIYKKDNSFIDKLKKMEPIIFSEIPCIYHYVKMAKGNFKTVQEKHQKLKTYLNVIRPLLMAMSIKKYHRMNSLNVNDLIKDLLQNNERKQDIEQMIKMKTAGQRVTKRILAIDTFIEEEIQYLEQYVSKLEYDRPNPTQLLDQLFRETLADAWK
ncbi:nucleotidyltransferase domain-containing protein [Bacillus sp. JJ1533]|uniref:nucleotidyltransferase domain-containing protein n=1 Tax=Bacillus sp. JJ1533 TaxID=3122959 RepID=UPI002FFE0906